MVATVRRAGAERAIRVTVLRARRRGEATVPESTVTSGASAPPLPLKTALEQLDVLGEEVVPVPREEFATGRPAGVPDAPAHAALRAAREVTAAGGSSPSPTTW